MHVYLQEGFVYLQHCRNWKKNWDPKGSGHYSPTGIWGDPTLASKEKGKIIVEMTIQAIVKQINQLIEMK